MEHLLEYDCPESVVLEARPEYPKFNLVPETAPRRRGATPTLPPVVDQAIRFLSRSIYEDFVTPSLALPDQLTYVAFWRQHWNEFRDALNALRTTLMLAVEPPEAARFARAREEKVMARIARLLPAVAGGGSAEELDFASSTIHRAYALAQRIATMPSIKGGETAQSDAELCFRFKNASGAYTLGLLSLHAMTHGRKVSPVIIPSVLEVLRKGALDSYQFAREAIDLRAERRDAPSEGIELDDEDRELALQSLPVIEGEPLA